MLERARELAGRAHYPMMILATLVTGHQPDDSMNAGPTHLTPSPLMIQLDGMPSQEARSSAGLMAKLAIALK
jgi:hypothetical protein